MRHKVLAEAQDIHIMKLEFTLNGAKVALQDIPGSETLLDLLRERLELTGAKEGCGVGECGACTVLVDDEPVNSCLTPAWKVSGRKVTTIEGIGSLEKPHPLQKAFIECGAIQCGFCTPGSIMAAMGLLKRSKSPAKSEIKSALSGNLCRCGGYTQIIQAVEMASENPGDDDNG